jgi:CheY-like chemotaxis protein
VEVTYCGIDALEVAKRFRPDLIITDLVMPVMDGFELVRRLRQIPAFAQTKVLAVTGQRNHDFQQLAFSAGFDAVLSKPISFTDLRAVLVNFGPRDVNNIPYSSLSCNRLRGQSTPDSTSVHSRHFCSPPAQSKMAYSPRSSSVSRGTVIGASKQ